MLLVVMIGKDVQLVHSPEPSGGSTCPLRSLQQTRVVHEINTKEVTNSLNVRTTGKLYKASSTKFDPIPRLGVTEVGPAFVGGTSRKFADITKFPDSWAI